MTNSQQIFWNNLTLNDLFNPPTAEDLVNADLEGVTIEQYRFNKWIARLEKEGDGFMKGMKIKSDGPIHVKLAWWKCWFWWAIPGFFLGVDDRIKFRGWKIGRCLNCDANPYDGTVEAWSYDANWYRGALIRCNKCKQLRWQPGESGTDY